MSVYEIFFGLLLLQWLTGSRILGCLTTLMFFAVIINVCSGG